MLIDGTVRKFLIARVNVDTPYYKGELKVMRMKAPIYELVIGNILRSRGLDEPDQDADSEEVTAVTTSYNLFQEDKKSARSKLSRH